MSIYACFLYGLLAVLLIGFKAYGVLTCSWWWALAPVWGLWVLPVAVLAWVGITGLIVGLIRP